MVAFFLKDDKLSFSMLSVRSLPIQKRHDVNKDSEYLLPEDVFSAAKIVGLSDEEFQKFIFESKGEEDTVIKILGKTDDSN